MTANAPRDHHYAPQFYLRNFAVDPEQKKIATVMKHGGRAVWARRSIEGIGFERYLYVHMRNGAPVSVESAINERVETPISKSDTWAKIASGRTDALDRSDKPILYALIRHLEVRTPHYLATTMELAKLATSPDSGMQFSQKEREMYAFFRANPEVAKAMLNTMSSSLEWTEQNFYGCGLSVLRSPISLYASTTPVVPGKAPAHPALHLPLPGMVPYQLLLTLNKNTAVSLVLGDFNDGFMNIEIDVVTARGLNRNYVCQFAMSEHVRHLIADADGLIEEMTWAPYDLVEQTERKIAFRRRAVPM